MSAHHERMEPVGGPILTPAFVAASALFGAAALLVLYRLFAGIGAVSALNDGFSWGSWKVFNVIVLTALGSGGYATAVLVYALNRGRYHPLVRTAILTSAMGYTTGVIALGIDIGRPWNFWVMAKVWDWNLHSPLLEIAACITAYLVFLWAEMAVPLLERWKDSPRRKLAEAARRGAAFLKKTYPYVVAFAIVLPSMHQSSLGSLFLLSGPRVHPLWQSDLLPFFFLLTAFSMGWAAVVMVALLSSAAWDRPVDHRLLAGLSRAAAWVLLLFVATRWIDVALAGETALAFGADRFAILFLLESVLLVSAALGMLSGPLDARPSTMFRLAMLSAAGGMLYRLDASLIAFLPGEHYAYFPSVAEMTISAGFVALAVVGYVYIVKRFPILPAAAGSRR